MKTMVLLLSMVLGVSALQAQTRTSVKISDLPKAISDNITNQHKGYTAQEAFKVDTKGVITYEVVARNAGTSMNFIYDQNGSYLRMEPHKLAASSPSQSSAGKSSVKPANKPRNKK